MNEIHIKNLTYSGTKVESDVNSAISGSYDPKRLRLEVFIDGSDLREPFYICRHLSELGSGNWEWKIDRKWPFENKIEFQLWVDSGPSTSPPEKSYEHTDKRLWKDEVTSRSSNAFSAISNLSIPYTVEAAPDPIVVQVSNPNGSGNVDQIQFPRDVRSALDDFSRVIDKKDDGLGFIKQEDVVAIADDLANRVDEFGLGTSSDNWPDTPIDIADQGPRGYCGPAALLLAMGIHRPRRAVEFCHSVYQPELYKENGSRGCGVLARTSDLQIHSLKSYYESLVNGNGRSSLEATQDIMVTVMRYTLNNLPPIGYIGGGDNDEEGARNQYRNPSGGGLNHRELELLLTDVVGVIDAGNMRNVGGERILQIAGQWAASGKSAILLIDSTLVRFTGPKTKEELNNKCYEPVDFDHAVTVLSTGGGTEGQLQFVYHNPWGGGVGVQNVDPIIVDKYVTKVVGGSMEDF